MGSNNASSCSDMCLYVLAIFLPFLTVCMVDGCGCQTLINILLCCLAWIPGVIHAWWRIGRSERTQNEARAAANYGGGGGGGAHHGGHGNDHYQNSGPPHAAGGGSYGNHPGGPPAQGAYHAAPPQGPPPSAGYPAPHGPPPASAYQHTGAPAKY